MSVVSFSLTSSLPLSLSSFPRKNYKFAKTAAPPNSAPTATAAVCTGPALGLVALEAAELALCDAELRRELAELVREAIARLRDSRSEPVAVESCDEYDERREPASLVMELKCEVISELIEERAEVTLDSIDSMGSTGLVTVAVWAWCNISGS